MAVKRKVLTLQAKVNGVINYNYQFKLMQEIYNILQESDEEFGQFLHDEGILVDNKKYKLYNSHVYFVNAGYTKSGINVKKEDFVKLTICGQSGTVEAICDAIIKYDNLIIGNLGFTVEGVTDLPDLNYSDNMIYRVRNPIVESTFYKGKIKYLDINDLAYMEAVRMNLHNKYKAIYGKDYSEVLQLEIIGDRVPKQKLISTVPRSYIIGFTDFDIKITASEDMQRICYNLGLGQNNSMGMGHLYHMRGVTGGNK